MSLFCTLVCTLRQAYNQRGDYRIDGRFPFVLSPSAGSWQALSRHERVPMLSGKQVTTMRILLDEAEGLIAR